MKTITEKDYVDKAERVIKELSEKKNPRTGREVPMVTTSQIRNLLAMTADIYNTVVNDGKEQLSEDVVARIEYLRVRFVYESGRDGKVKDFVEAAGILDVLPEIGTSRKNYILFNRYMEALVAYHRYYGGKEK